MHVIDKFRHFRWPCYLKPAIGRVQALADISRSALCCHSNETRAPIANTPNSAQLEGTPYHSPSYIRVRAVVWEFGEGQTYTDTQTAVTNIHFTSARPHATCTKWCFCRSGSRTRAPSIVAQCWNTVYLSNNRHHRHHSRISFINSSSIRKLWLRPVAPYCRPPVFPLHTT